MAGTVWQIESKCQRGCALNCSKKIWLLSDLCLIVLESWRGLLSGRHQNESVGNTCPFRQWGTFTLEQIIMGIAKISLWWHSAIWICLKNETDEILCRYIDIPFRLPTGYILRFLWSSKCSLGEQKLRNQEHYTLDNLILESVRF